jgi:Fic family protein
MLEGVEQTSRQTIVLVQGISQLMQSSKQKIRAELTKIYSQDLLNNLFRHPYTKIDFVMNELEVSRVTATRYLNELVKIGVLEKFKLGKSNYYINTALFELLSNAGKA